MPSLTEAQQDALDQEREADRLARPRYCRLCCGEGNCPECGGWDEEPEDE